MPQTNMAAFEHFMAAVTAVVDAERRRLQAGHLRAWRDWIKEAGTSGRGWAHKWTNPGETWKPARVGPGDPFTGRPRDMLEREKARLSGVWECSETPRAWFQAELEFYRALPEFTVAEFIRASRSFSPKTSQTWSGFHPRHYSLLNEEQAQVALELLRFIERVGVLPTVLQGIYGKLIPKHKAGALDVSFHSIGLMPSLYRLCARVRREEARSWEQRNKIPMIGHQSGRSIMEVVFVQALRAEAGQHEAEVRHSGCFLWDMKNFYEHVGYEKL